MFIGLPEITWTAVLPGGGEPSCFKDYVLGQFNLKLGKSLFLKSGRPREWQNDRIIRFSPLNTGLTNLRVIQENITTVIQRNNHQTTSRLQSLPT